MNCTNCIEVVKLGSRRKPSLFVSPTRYFSKKPRRDQPNQKLILAYPDQNFFSLLVTRTKKRGGKPFEVQSGKH